MTEADIRLGLLGAGRWGQRYIETIKTVAGTRLAAVASKNPDTRKIVATDCRVYADWHELVKTADIDAVIIATPPRLHAEMAEAALDAGRPVLIEKPMTLSVETAQALERKSRAQNVLVMVGHTQLFNAAFRKMKRSLPDIGLVRHIVSNSGNWGPFRSDVSPLWDYAPHDLSMCIDLLEALPTRVVARREARETVDHGVGERYLIDLTFPRNITAQIRVGNLVRPKRRRLEVTGERGALMFDDLAEQKLTERLGRAEKPLSYDSERPLTTQVREFVAAVRFRRASDPSLQLGREVVEILARCEDQMKR